jgi:hypothetical protein
MTKLQKIEESVAALSSEELKAFSEWFAEFEAERWDRQIEQDSASGRLDKLIADAREEIAAGKIRPL